ncbi:MAG: hypothetical protein ACRBN8_02100 [Nannocystales bacterium]
MLRALPLVVALLAPSEDSDSMIIRWTAPAHCPTEADVRQALTAEGHHRGDSKIRITAEIENLAPGAPARLSIEVVAGDTRIQRTVRGEGCAQLGATAALIIGIALDLLPAAPRIVEPPPAPGPADPPPRRPQTPAQQTPAAQPPATPWVLDMRVGAGLQSGPLPTGPVVTVALGVQRRRLRASVAGHYAPPRPVVAFPEEDAGALVQGGGVQARGCAVLAVGAWAFPSCVGAEVGIARAAGVNFVRTQAAHRAWAAVVFGPEVVWALHPVVGAFAGLDGVVSMLRPSFSADGLGVVHRGQTLGLRVQLGLVLRPGAVKREKKNY